MTEANTLTPSAIKVIDIYDDGQDSRHIQFAAPAPIRSAATPGQFFMLSLPGHGEAAFTYVSLPDEAGRFTALIRKAGSLTRAALSLQVGDFAGYRGPLGIGWPLAALENECCLLVAGGCGLAPLSAVIDYILEHGRASKCCLLYGSRSHAHQVLGRERARWQDKLAIIEALDVCEDPLCRGNVLNFTGKAEHILGGQPSRLLCCGPEKMMDSVCRHYLEKGISPEKIWLSVERRMHCGIGTCGHCYIGSSYACKDGPTYRYDRLMHHLKQSQKKASPPQQS